MLIVVALLLVTAAAGAGYWWFFLRAHGAAAAKAPPPPPTPIYLALDPMIVNLKADDMGPHVLRIGITLDLSSQASEDELTKRMPAIRSQILISLSDKDPSELATPEDKIALGKEIKSLIGQASGMSDKTKSTSSIRDVYFTEFVVQ